MTAPREILVPVDSRGPPPYPSALPLTARPRRRRMARGQRAIEKPSPPGLPVRVPGPLSPGRLGKAPDRAGRLLPQRRWPEVTLIVPSPESEIR